MGGIESIMIYEKTIMNAIINFKFLKDFILAFLKDSTTSFSILKVSHK